MVLATTLVMLHFLCYIAHLATTLIGGFRMPNTLIWEEDSGTTGSSHLLKSLAAPTQADELNVNGHDWNIPASDPSTLDTQRFPQQRMTTRPYVRKASQACFTQRYYNISDWCGVEVVSASAVTVG